MLFDDYKPGRLDLFGEDCCDLVATIEDAFGVMLNEDDLVQSTTLGKLAHRIFAKLQHPRSAKCLSALTFYRLRRAVVTLLDVPRDRISPSTSLNELMPWLARNKRWRRIAAHLDLVLPRLVWPIWLFAVSLLLIGLMIYAFFHSEVQAALGNASVLLDVVAVITILLLVARLLNPLGRAFPAGCQTVGDLATLVLAYNYGKLARTHGISSEKELEQLLLRLVSSEVACDVQRISPDTFFPEGLNIY
jgi:hypothetical protein